MNITTAALEQLANERLGRAVARSTRRAVSARELRGGWSGSSSELVKAQFVLIERMYLGDARYPGIAALIKPAAPAIEQHLRARFQAAHDRLGELDRPLEQLPQSQAERLSTSHAALRDLERVLKTEVSSALGVTLTFESSDGD